MRMRGIHKDDKDWLYGKGRNDYKRDRLACAQDVETRLLESLGDCFFNNPAGIDWFNFLGGKDLVGLKLAIATTILNTEDVTGINELSLVLNDQRALTVTYEVSTSFGTFENSFVYENQLI